MSLKINNYEKTNKKGGKKKEGNLPKPLPSFSFFRPLLSLLPMTIYINKKNYFPTFQCSSSKLFKATILENEKIMSPITYHEDVEIYFGPNLVVFFCILKVRTVSNSCNFELDSCLDIKGNLSL